MADYSAFKVVELKEQCKERGIPQTGLSRKQQYIEALEAQDGENDKLGEIAVEGVNVNTTDEGEAGGQQQQQQREAEGEDANGSEQAGNGSIDNSAVDLQDDNSELPAAQAEVSETPRVGSLGRDEPSPDSRKRKRRSPTPPVRDESVQKRLRAAEEDELPRLAEDMQSGEAENASIVLPTGDAATDEPVPTAQEQLDEVVEDAPAPVEDSDVVMQQAGVSDDVQDFAQTTTADAAVDSEPIDIDEDIGPPAQHQPTSALYIRHLLRPLQLQPFREHLEDISAPSGSDPSSSDVLSLHLDFYKSHAFAVFSSPSHAIRARKALHDSPYPNEAQRKPLWVDFIPASQVPAWTDTENEAGRTKRFEIGYSASGTATLEQVPSGSQSQPRNSVSAAPSQQQQPGPGMPNAPTGPRSDRLPSQQQQQQQQHHHSSTPSAPAPRKRQPPSTSHLDSLFPSTTSSPKLFYRPASPTLVSKRLDEFARETSRDWNDGRRAAVVAGGRLGGHLDQLRRYTFEDGDVIVDGGPDFGGFGARQGAGGGGAPGGYMGGAGGGGGGRGRRGGGGRGRR